jgi:ribokinase
MLVVNKGELATVSAHHGSIEQCLERIDVPCVVVTLGANGCCARVDGKFLMQNAFAVMPVDTTAAGDTFCGVLVAALSRQLGMAEAMRMANAAGALTCTRLGAQSSIPTRAELEAFLAGRQPDASMPEVPLSRMTREIY